MAGLSILLPLPSTSISPSYVCINHDFSYCYHSKNNNINNHNCKVQALLCSSQSQHHFTKSKSNLLIPKLYQMPAHLPKSEKRRMLRWCNGIDDLLVMGSRDVNSLFTKKQGSSWIQDSSVPQTVPSIYKLTQGPVHSVFPTKSAEVSSLQDLYEFICSGPLISKLSITSEFIAESIDKWLSYGSLLCRLFQLNEMQLTTPQRARIYHYYIPVFVWCEDKISKHRSKFKDGEDIPPLVIGFSAPQGCGKTTLVFALNYLFQVTGRNSATLSIDDFYLTYEGQAKLREANPRNALLEFRGNAGSHDLQLSVETLTALQKLTKEGMKMKLPRYDKSAYNGRGDRADPSTWTEVEGPLTVVLFEGWMLGFKPLPMEAIRAVDPQLETVNKNLEAYYDAWDKFVKAWIVIKIQDPSCVYQWRLQAEIAMREEGKPGMSDEEVKDFVSRYLPAYNAYLPTLYDEGPKGSDVENLLIIEIDEGRNPILGN